jgi:hypothetical protein
VFSGKFSISKISLVPSELGVITLGNSKFGWGNGSTFTTTVSLPVHPSVSIPVTIKIVF